MERIKIIASLLKKIEDFIDSKYYLANCYYKTHQVAPAIFNYEKALLVNPDFENAKTNLEFAKKLQLDDIKVIPKVGLGTLLFDATKIMHYDTWAWLAVTFSFLVLGSSPKYFTIKTSPILTTSETFSVLSQANSET